MSKLIVFSAPSGCGKSTIINLLKERGMKFNYSVSATSRAPRGFEQDGVDYYFLSPEQFKAKIANGEFVEYEEVYKDQFYGTLKAEVDHKLELSDVMFDIDVKGALNIKRIYGERAVCIFILPPSVDELSRRLRGRGTETEEQIHKRLAKAEYEISFAPQFDYQVVNDDLAKAVETIENILR